MFPETQDLTMAAVEETAAFGKSFLFDFSKGDFVVRDGKLVECDGIDGVKVWVEKILRTEKGRFKIYDNMDYGCHLEDLIIGGSFPVEFIESELKREVTDALLQNPQITGVTGFKAVRGTNSITVSMEVETNDEGTNTVTVTL